MGKTFSTGLLTNGIWQDSSNNIGIGAAASGSFKLQVTGTTNLTGALTGTSATFSGDLTLNNGSADGGQLVLASSGFSNWNLDNFSGRFRAYYGATEYFTILANGNVGIGTNNPVSRLSIGGDGYADRAITAIASGTDFAMTVQQNSTGAGIQILRNGGNWGNAPFQIQSTSGGTQFIVNSSGKVGIGTNSPDNSYQGLTIFGSDPSLRLKTNSTGGWTWTEYVNSSNVNNFSVGVNQAAPFFGIKAGAGMDNPNIVLTSAGNIGFGLTNPGRPIVAYYSVAGSVMEVWNYRNNGSGDFAFVTVLGSNDANTNNYHYIASTGGADRFYVYGNGNVVNTNGSYGTLSDSTLKENIVDATPKLDDLLQLKVRNFNLIDDENKTKQIGFIAQEFEEVFPAMIDTDGKTGMKTIKTSVLVPMLVKAIQELSAKVTALENR